MKQRGFKVGDRVYDYCKDEWGVVRRISTDTYPVKVEFDSDSRISSYTSDGRFFFDDPNPVLSHQKPVFSQERVVLVSLDGKKWHKRVFVKLVESEYPFVTWSWAETIEDAKEIIKTSTWKFMKELDEKPLELTLEEIADKFGVSVEQIKIKK